MELNDAFQDLNLSSAFLRVKCDQTVDFEGNNGEGVPLCLNTCVMLLSFKQIM